jgi:hypothetical protein
MKRIVVELSGMPAGPAYETGDGTIAIGDLVRVPGSGSDFIKDSEPERSSRRTARAPGHASASSGPPEKVQAGDEAQADQPQPATSFRFFRIDL